MQIYTRFRLWFSLAFCSLVCTACFGMQGQDASATPSPSVSAPPTAALAHSPPMRPVPANSISDAQVDAHIPRNASQADRKTVKAVMLMLPQRLRQYVTWFHVPARRGTDYDSLPNHGLVVVFDGPQVENGPQDHSSDLPGLYVLYYDGRVQPNSHVIYDARLDSYLTPVPTNLHEELKEWHML
jgi:hypothetical protein